MHTMMHLENHTPEMKQMCTQTYRKAKLLYNSGVLPGSKLRHLFTEKQTFLKRLAISTAEAPQRSIKSQCRFKSNINYHPTPNGKVKTSTSYLTVTLCSFLLLFALAYDVKYFPEISKKKSTKICSNHLNI